MAPAQKEVRAVKTNRNEIQLAQLNMKVEEWPFQSLKNKLDATATAASLSVSKKNKPSKIHFKMLPKKKQMTHKQILKYIKSTLLTLCVLGYKYIYMAKHPP